MYKLLDRELPAILMAVLVTLAFFLVFIVIPRNRRKVPLVFIEIIGLYFPDIDIDTKGKEIEVLGKKLIISVLV